MLTSDPVRALDEVLRALPVTGTVFCRARLGRPWGVFANPTQHAVFHVVVRGGGWVRIEGQRDPVQVSAGDLLLVTRGAAHDMGDAPDGSRVDLYSLVPQLDGSALPCLHHGGDGEITELLCGKVEFPEHAGHTLVDLFPPLVHLRAGAEGFVDWIEQTLGLVSREVEQNLPGAETVIAKLAEVLFVQIVREYARRLDEHATGWLMAMRDPQITRAMELIHGQPGESLTVDVLARRAGMSRSAFCARFRELVGETPAHYLTRWRVHRACIELSHDDRPIVEVAQEVGYGSERAFAKAFKRVVGKTPREFRHMARGAA